MKNIAKHSLKIFFGLAFFATPAKADLALPDLYIKDMYFSGCDDSEIDQELSEESAIHANEEDSYFDMASEPDPETGYIGHIFRTYCFNYTVGNKGNTEINSGFNSAPSDEAWRTLSITDPKWLKVDFYSGMFTGIKLKPGEFYSQNQRIEIDLNRHAHSEQNCIGLEIKLKSKEELDTTNNKKTLCFKPSEYSFPKAPQNFIASKAVDQTLELTWDEVEGADNYKILAINVAANADFKNLEPISLVNNKAVFEFPNQDSGFMPLKLD